LVKNVVRVKSTSAEDIYAVKISRRMTAAFVLFGDGGKLSDHPGGIYW
jgi:hypothetical protein